jgi:hypothetical protein
MLCRIGLLGGVPGVLAFFWLSLDDPHLKRPRLVGADVSSLSSSTTILEV